MQGGDGVPGVHGWAPQTNAIGDTAPRLHARRGSSSIYRSSTMGSESVGLRGCRIHGRPAFRAGPIGRPERSAGPGRVICHRSVRPGRGSVSGVHSPSSADGCARDGGGRVEVDSPKEPQQEKGDAAPPDSSTERAVSAPTSAPQVAAPGTEAPAAAPVTEAENAAAPAPPAAAPGTEAAAAAPITEPEAPAAAAPAMPPSPEQAEAESDVAVAATPTPLQQATPLPPAHRDESEQVATPGPSMATSDIPEAASSKAEDGTTAVVWRVLEGVFGGVALLLVGGVLWRMRRLWRRTVS